MMVDAASGMRAADRTVTLKRVVLALGASAPSEAGATLLDRVRLLDLAGVEIEQWEEVVDPAGGEQPEFDACAKEIDALVDQLIALL
jgi:protein-tyrosine-phosphatase